MQSLVRHTLFHLGGIWEARKLLKEGCIWQIGNGKSINLWTNYWLPGYKYLSWANPICAHANELKVESLFHYLHCAWNNERFIDLFPPSIAAEVFKQIIPTVACKDCLLWEHERDEMYNVHSGYRLSNRLARMHYEGESSNAILQKQDWKKE